MHEHTDDHRPAPLSDVQARARAAWQQARDARRHAALIRDRATVTRARTGELLERAKARLATAHETLNRPGHRRNAGPTQQDGHRLDRTGPRRLEG